MEAQAYAELHQLEPTHWWYRGMRAVTTALLEGVAATPSELRILDAGCGVGGNLGYLAPYGQTTGCDYSSLALAYAAERHSGRLVQATVEQLPYQKNSFDLVTSFDVLYALEVEDDGRALAEFVRVLAPRAYLLLRLPALKALAGSHDIVVHGRRRYTRQEIEEKLRAAGLKVLRTTYANSLLLPIIYGVRRWQKAAGQAAPTDQSDVRPTHPLINSLLYRCLCMEAAWIKRGHAFPAGVSVIALAQKEG